MLSAPTPASRQLRASHWSRFVDAGFLLVWMAFWIVGEAVALALVVGMIASALSAALDRPTLLASWAPRTDGSVSVFLLFLLFWLTLWTIGGIAAGTHLLRRLAGRDDVDVTMHGIGLTRRAGPFRKRRDIPRAAIRRVRIRSKDRSVVTDTDTGTVEISDLGDADERRALHAWLSSALGLPDENRARLRERELPPLGRDVETQGAETIVTTPSRRIRVIRARILWFVAALMSLGWIDALRRGFMSGATTGEVMAAVATLLVAAAGALFMDARSEWALRSGRMSVRRRLAHWTWREHDFQASASIALEHTLDSDGDDHYNLVIIDSSARRVLNTALHDPHELLALGEWLSARTGFPFKRLSSSV